MADAVSELVDYLRYRRECGETAVDLDPETVAALKAVAAQPGGGARSPGEHAPTQPSVGARSPSEAAAAQPSGGARSPSEHVSAQPSGGARSPSEHAKTRPDFLFIGERENIEETAYGELLRKMIASMGYTMADVAMANVCGGGRAARPPTQEEMAEALPALRRRIAEINPVGIVVMGATAALGVLGNADISSIHGHVFTFEGRKTVPTYHPAYIKKFEKTTGIKRDVISDLCNALEAIGRPVPEGLARFRRK